MLALPNARNTLAVVVTYHPDDEVPRNVAAARQHVGRVLVVDNTPGGGGLDALREIDGVEVHEMGRNTGIAHALNRGIGASLGGGYEWTLLLDQDTLLLPGYLDAARAAARAAGEEVGVVGVNFASRWTGAPYVRPEGGVRDVPFAVSSGSLLRAACVRSAGWLREDYFIDYVDVEYGLRARRAGFSVVLAPEVQMEHAMAATTEHRLLGYARKTAGYSPARHYYMARNLMLTARTHGRREGAWLRWEALQRAKLAALTLAMEPDRKLKLQAMLHGYADALRGRTGEAPRRYDVPAAPPKPAPAPQRGAGRVYVQVPYLDERAAGMQRYVAGMVPALQRAGLAFTTVVGEVHGRVEWLERVPHAVVLSERLTRRVPRPALAVIRTLWLQFAFPAKVGRGATLLALAHEVAPRPAFRQVAVVHDLTEYKAFARRTDPIARVRNWLWRAGLKRSDGIIAISEATARDLADTLGIAGPRVRVVYEGVDRELFRPAAGDAPPERPFLLYAGTLDPHKNVPFLLRVHAALAERGCGVVLVLVGRYGRVEAEAMADRVPAGLRDLVSWAGYVSDAELARLLRTCAAFVFPSRNEGFGLAVAEAMACGAPVVSSSAGSLAEVVGDGGVLLPPDDEAAWVAALEGLLREPARRAALSARALARAELFSWDRAAEAYRAILQGEAPATPAPTYAGAPPVNRPAATSSPGLGLAAFDVCGTLYRSNTTLDFLAYHFEGTATGWALVFLDTLPGKALSVLFNRVTGRDAVRAWAVGRLVGQRDADVRASARAFVRERLPALEVAPVLALWRQAQREGWQMVLASGSLAPVVEAIGEALGADAVVASRLEVQDGRLTGAYAEDVLHAKLEALADHLPEGTDLLVVTDNPTDRALLERASRRVYVYPARRGSAAVAGLADVELIRLP